jgi:3-oxoacyl-[acyl-carrier protein] reductase
MLRQRSGRIINISSISGIMGNVGQINYSAAKAGIIGLTRSLAKEMGSRQITVNAICPGFIETDMTAKLSDAIKEEAKKRIPLASFGKPEDIAAAVTFFASDYARYITGQFICIDGGMITGW